MGLKSRTLHKILTLLVFSIVLLQTGILKAQDLKIFASDTFIGTFNGALLGGGTMALENKIDVAPIRFGVGLGTLYGLGIGVADVSNMKNGQPYQGNGTVGSAGNTAQVILMDTFYGGIAGSLIGMSISLIGNQKVVKGLQYGIGAGVWAGFGFGAVDVFYFGRNHPVFGKTLKIASRNYDHSGLIQLTTHKMGHFSFVSPVAIYMPKTSKMGLGIKTHLGLEVARWQISL